MVVQGKNRYSLKLTKLPFRVKGKYLPGKDFNSEISG